jgi:hypothetical protein
MFDPEYPPILRVPVRQLSARLVRVDDSVSFDAGWWAIVSVGSRVLEAIHLSDNKCADVGPIRTAVEYLRTRWISRSAMVEYEV